MPSDSRLGIRSISTKMLILTSEGRLFYVDAATLKTKECELRLEAAASEQGSAPPTPRGTAGAATSSTLSLWQKGKKLMVQTVIHSAADWARELSQASRPDRDPASPAMCCVRLVATPAALLHRCTTCSALLSRGTGPLVAGHERAD